MQLKGNRIHRRLERIYGPETALEILPDLERLIEKYAGTISPQTSGWSEADAFLITYADSITGDAPPLQILAHFLREQVGNAISMVHLLPFYPYSSDDGFAVEDFREVRSDLGDWEDIRSLSKEHRLVFDGVINHVSSTSVYMQGYVRGDPACEDFFVALDPATDTSKVLRTRNLPLLHEYDTVEGKRWLWTTFSDDQIDLNFRNPKVLLEIVDVLFGYAAAGASIIRLDAIPYLWKQLGTSCAHLPETHELIKLLRDLYNTVAPHVLLLTETNVPHNENISYFGDRGDEAQIIYNFSLPPLVLWSLVEGDATILSKWAQSIEYIGERATYLNITATHDGIGMRPTEGILSETQRARLVQMAYDHGGAMTGKRNEDGSVAPYELNLSYFDAVNDPRNDEPDELRIARFLVAQSIPMALMGIPGIYIHSLLGSRNDYAGVEASGRARSINRQQLDLESLQTQLADPTSLRARIFSQIKARLELRARQRAFSPDAPQCILDLGPGVFAVERTHPASGERLIALHNVTNAAIDLPLGGASPDLRGKDILNDEAIGFDSKTLSFSPYQVRWINAEPLTNN